VLLRELIPGLARIGLVINIKTATASLLQHADQVLER